MKMGFFAHNFIKGDGQGRVQYEVVQRARDLGYHVTLFADRVASELVSDRVKWERIRVLPRRPNLIGVYAYNLLADRIVRRVRREFDVIIAGGFTIQEQHDVNLCQFVNGAWMQSPVHVSKLSSGPNAWYQAAYTRLNAISERQTYAGAKFVVAPSRRIKNDLQGIGVPADQIDVIRNGVDLEEFRPGPVEREELGLPDGVPLALFCGDIRTPRKNLDTVLHAMVRLEQVHLAVVGDARRSPFPALAAQLGVSDRVHFMGFRRDIARFMRCCDLFVFPSRYEAGTLVLIEAMASGLPVISATTAGGSEIISPDAGVVLEDPNDATRLAEAMTHYLEDEDRSRAAGQHGRAIASQQSWTTMADQILALCARACGAQHSARTH